MKRRTRFVWLTSSVLVLVLVGCSSEDEPPAGAGGGAETGTVEDGSSDATRQDSGAADQVADDVADDPVDDPAEDLPIDASVDAPTVDLADIVEEDLDDLGSDTGEGNDTENDGPRDLTADRDTDLAVVDLIDAEMFDGDAHADIEVTDGDAPDDGGLPDDGGYVEDTSKYDILDLVDEDVIDLVDSGPDLDLADLDGTDPDLVCALYCVATVAEACPNSPAHASECEGICTTSVCETERNLAVATCGPSTTYFCDVAGNPFPADCGQEEFLDYFQCVGREPQCEDYCPLLVDADCDNSPPTIESCEAACAARAGPTCEDENQVWIDCLGPNPGSLSCSAEGHPVLSACEEAYSILLGCTPPLEICSAACPDAVAASCTGGPTTLDECRENCNDWATGPCVAELDAALTCAVSAVSVACDSSTGEAYPTGCLAETEALLGCMETFDLCRTSCVDAVAASCAGGPATVEACEANCEARAGGPCGDLLAEVVECGKTASSVACHPATGEAYPDGCLPQTDALLTCGLPDCAGICDIAIASGTCDSLPGGRDGCIAECEVVSAGSCAAEALSLRICAGPEPAFYCAGGVPLGIDSCPTESFALISCVLSG